MWRLPKAQDLKIARTLVPINPLFTNAYAKMTGWEYRAGSDVMVAIEEKDRLQREVEEAGETYGGAYE